MSSNISVGGLCPVNRPNASLTEEIGASNQQDVSRAVFTILYVFLWLLGAGGNMLVVLCVATEPKLRSTSNVLIAHVACSDFLYSFIILSTIIEMHQHTLFTCGIVAWFGIVLFMTSVHSQLLVSVNRYMLVAKPAETYQKWFKKKYVVIAIVFMWLFDFAVYAVVAAAAAQWESIYIPGLNICIFWSQSFNFALNILVMSCSSFIVAVICYLKLLIYVKKNTMSIGSSKRREVKASVVLFVVMILFFVTYTILPAILTAIGESDIDPNWKFLISQFAIALQWSNFCINPILYGLRIHDFKTTYKKILFPCKRQVEPLTH